MRVPVPPILVHRTTMRVIDGMHRLRAAVRRGQDTIEERFIDGEERDLFVLAIETNTEHGRPLSQRDRMDSHSIPEETWTLLAYPESATPVPRIGHSRTPNRPLAYPESATVGCRVGPNRPESHRSQP